MSESTAIRTLRRYTGSGSRRSRGRRGPDRPALAFGYNAAGAVPYRHVEPVGAGRVRADRATCPDRYPMPSAPALPGAGGLLLGIGDDAAVWTPTPGTRVVATTDALVEGVHFDLRFTSWRDLGWKALAVNVSDAAAMGATPRFALVTLGLSRGRSLEELESLYHGLADHAARFAVQVVGGDVVSSPTTFLSVALLAEAGAHLLRRDAARPGDQVAVTGTLGDA